MAVAALCAELGVPHIINNAYGLQAGAITHAVNEAMRVGRVDAVVQSTDKAFLVPVGGGLLFSADEAFVAAVARSYAGRASAVWRVPGHTGWSGKGSGSERRGGRADCVDIFSWETPWKRLYLEAASAGLIRENQITFITGMSCLSGCAAYQASIFAMT